jgi:DNA-binding transcriptional regulator YiaG
MRNPTKENLADLLVQSLTEVRDGLRGRTGRLTMKTLEIPDPPHFTAAAVHKLRDRLALSQGLFARLLGVSRKLVEAWEAGTRTPSPMACRLLDAIARNPSHFLRRPRRVASAFPSKCV